MKKEKPKTMKDYYYTKQSYNLCSLLFFIILKA